MMKIKLILLVILVCASVAKVKSQDKIQQDSLLVYYPFNVDLNDKSGNNYVGKVYGAKLVGNKNKAAYFDGADDFIEVQGIEALKKVKYLTVSCWINPFTKKPWDSWVSKANTYNNNSQWRLSFDQKPDQMELTTFKNGWKNYLVDYQMEDKKWYHVVYLIDAVNNKASCYVDGVKIKTWDIGEMNQSDGSLFIGYQWDDRVCFHGMIDEIRIYNRLLREDEIQSQYDVFKTSDKAVYEEKIESYNYVPPNKLNDGIDVSGINTRNCDTSLLNRLMFDFKNKKYGAVYSCLIVKDNNLVVEEYFNDFRQDQKQHLYSSTKSFASILVGKAIELGFIKSDSDLISNYLPEVKKLNLQNGTEKLKIKDLLTMSSGIDGAKIFYSDSVNKNNHPVFILKNQENVKPGIKFLYKDSDPHLIAHIIYNSTGQTIDKFADKYLLKPMQIENYEWSGSYCGISDADVGLCVTPRDFMKLGLLVINNGKWKNQQIINSDWVSKSTQQMIVTSNKNSDGYGFFWWTSKFKINDSIIYCYNARGFDGQYLIVFPAQNMIIVFTCQLANYKTVLNPLIQNFILPSFIKN